MTTTPTEDIICHSTYSDLLFGLCLLVPLTAVFCFVFWRYQMDAELVVAYTNQGSTLQAKIIHKDASISHEFRGSGMAAYQRYLANQEFETYEVPPYYLTVQYDTSSNRTIVKRLHVSQPIYWNANVGEHVEMNYVPGYDRSAIFLKDWQTTYDASAVGMCAFLCLLALGGCAMNACVTHGWWIIGGTLFGTFGSLWCFLNRLERKKLLQSVLEPREPAPRQVAARAADEATSAPAAEEEEEMQLVRSCQV